MRNAAQMTEKILQRYPEVLETDSISTWLKDIEAQYDKCVHVLRRHYFQSPNPNYLEDIRDIAKFRIYFKYSKIDITHHIENATHNQNEETK